MRVRISRQSGRKAKVVRMMNNAGRLTMSCTVIGLHEEKCSLMAPSAGAIAAPAITVSRLMERIAEVTPRMFFLIARYSFC